MYVGLLGGTFDPIHLGHLALAQGAMHLAGLDRVIFVPNRQPPHKAGRPVTDPQHRTAMVRLAIADNPAFDLSTLEVERSGPSYTIDTVRAFQSRHPDWRFAFLVGMDSLVQLTTWREYRALLQEVDLLVVNRPGVETADGQRVLAELGPEPARAVRLLTVPGVAVSATDLRRLAGAGYPLRYLVPGPVADYIARHRLYG